MPRKKKTYVILYDSDGYVLVGEGGLANHQPRQGYHLPGGNREGREDEYATALRELKEETGITIKLLEELDVKWAWGTVLCLENNDNVSFISLSVQNIDIEQLVEAARSNSEDHKSEDGTDQRFEKLHALEWTQDSWSNPQYFDEGIYTGWFAQGLAQMYHELFD